MLVLRIGIGSDYHKGQQVNFVLGKWNEQEAQQLPEIIFNCCRYL